MNNLIITEYDSPDKGLILSTYIKMLHCQKPYKYMKFNAFYSYQKELLLKLLSNENVNILTYTNVENSKHIISVLVYEIVDDIAIIHYVYTKPDFRNLGLATKLITSALPDFKIKPTLITVLPTNTKETLNKYKLRYDMSLLDRRTHG